MTQFNQTIIDPDEAVAQLDQMVIVDMRYQLSDPDWGVAQYADSHLPGAFFVRLDKDLSARSDGSNGRHPLPLQNKFSACLRDWGIDGSRQVMIYDQGSGAVAARLWWMINKWMGLKCAAVLDGGFAYWVRGGRPVTQDHVAPTPVTTPVAPEHTQSLVDMAEVRANLEHPTFIIVDARSTARFQGEIEPLDPVAGHIPNALNRPSENNLQENGRMKPAEELRREWLELIGPRDPAKIVHQCGSGITGCFNLLAMECAGLTGTRLYAGSWSEWCSHPDNPMVQQEQWDSASKEKG